MGSAIRPVSVAAAAADIIVLHGTDPASVYLSARARTQDTSLAAIEQALYDDGTLVRMLGMRRTVFVVPAGLAPVIQAACTDQIAARLRRQLTETVRKAGIAPDAEAWLRLQDPGKPEQLVFDLVDPILACGDFQQRLPRHVFDGIDQIRVGRPSLRNGCLHQLQSGVADFAGEQPLEQPDPRRGVFGGQGEIPGDDGFLVQRFGDRNQLAGKLFQSRHVEIRCYGIEGVGDTLQCPPTGRAQLLHQGVLDVSHRRRHGVELVQEAIDGG